MKIKTHYEFPPIPIRSFDWSAIDDETYDGEGCPIGFGATEAEAIEDLLDQIDPIPDVDDSEKFKRCRDPYLSRQSYGGDT